MIKQITFICSLVFLVGCSELPHQSGTWSGHCEVVTLYTHAGEPETVSVLTIEDGTLLADSSHRYKFIARSVVLVDKKCHALNPTKYIGHRLRVEGTVLSCIPISPISRKGLVNDTPTYQMQRQARPASLMTSEKNIQLLD